MKKKDDIFSVSQVNAHIKNMIFGNIPKLFIKGELSNLVFHRSGHIYFSLKDEGSSLRGVLFKRQVQNLEFLPKNGDSVVCFGKLDVYTVAGTYQIVAESLKSYGKGDLQEKFEKLKQKLYLEGLFDVKYKQSIPKFPAKIGIITSPSGAAIADIKSVIKRRYPCQTFLYPALVQGKDAHRQIIAGIEYFERDFQVDTIIISRGGGSQEDLFCFNSQRLARCIYGAKTPIISGIGHEIDFTIADFVSDLRAPTPSVAAELAVPEKNELFLSLQENQKSLLFYKEKFFYKLKSQFDDLTYRINRCNPIVEMEKRKLLLVSQQKALAMALEGYKQKKRSQLDMISSKFDDLSPIKTLKRGYAIVRQDKTVIKSAEQIDQNKALEIIFSESKYKFLIKKD